MRETETRQQECEVITAYICDVCGERYDDVLEMQEFIRIAFTGGYGSVFGDMCHFELDMCQYCAKEVLGEHLRWTDDPFQVATDAFVDSHNSGGT